ncbi:regulator component [Streptomyces tropicalis]|uniref:Regulator component n=1 Tax=Streptomyces tropicalis TaxID=3034234 RepID=A0ABT6A185_9ACTN|nr:regulator component [Streptomyces tropicalis]MDF3298405.1 regulator component [Streptomyces tropicalis]
MRTTGEYLELQRRCTAILRDLGVQPSLVFDALRKRVEELRGRPLVLRELPDRFATIGVCGLWLGTDDADYVFYEPRTAPLHREHIILHEIGHVLCDHHRGTTAGTGDRTAVAPHGGPLPGPLQALKTRTSYTTSDEQEAEMIASLIQSAGKPGRPAGRLGRLGSFLGVTSDDGH